MQAQLQAALASDQRAVTMASIFATVAAAIVAGALAYWDKKDDAQVLVAALAAATPLTIGAVLGMWAARPIDFYFPGNQPEEWYGCRNGSLAEALGGEAENYQERIGLNAVALGANQRAVAMGAGLAVCAPIAAISAWLIAGAIS